MKVQFKELVLQRSTCLLICALTVKTGRTQYLWKLIYSTKIPTKNVYKDTNKFSLYYLIIHKKCFILPSNTLLCLKIDYQHIFSITNETQFNKLALEIFEFQYHNNKVYNAWAKALKINVSTIHHYSQIPFLPIEFFKNHYVICGEKTEEEIVFTSSATTSATPSKHLVSDILIYETSFKKCFELQFGNVSNYCFLALLPNYLSRQGSSLVYMCNQLINDSKHAMSGFFLDDIAELKRRIEVLKLQKQKTILIGVTYALIDLCSEITLNDNFRVIETGGMKGTRKEILKEELHELLKDGFEINSISSEYGMTELLSQAYSKQHQEFECPPWMKILIREIDDPLKLRKESRVGGINVIDLANINSCSFIATKDLGVITSNGNLKLMGRYDNSDVRGCNLMFTG